MARTGYEIGLRGKFDDVAEFSENMKEFTTYYTGSVKEAGNRSFQASKWVDLGEQDELRNKIDGWTKGWSIRYPLSEAYYYFTAGLPAKRVVHYARYVAGDRTLVGTIDSHTSYDSTMPKFGVAQCECHNNWYESNPTMTPFEDCPIRVNPPTAWAVENLMEVMDRLPIRRAR